jgi:hypothetical protein
MRYLSKNKPMLESKMARIIPLLLFAFFSAAVNSQSLRWNAFIGPSFSPFRFEKTVAGQNDFKLKVYPGINIGTDFTYLRQNGWGIKTGVMANFETFHYDQVPFPKNEIISENYAELVMEQDALLLDIVKQYKPAGRPLTIFGGLTLNRTTVNSSGGGSSGSGPMNVNDTLPVGVDGTSYSDMKSYYSLGFNLGADFVPFKAVKYLSVGVQNNVQLSTANYLEAEFHYHSPYSGINYVRELKTYQRPNFLMLDLKIRLWSKDKSQSQR